MTQDMVNLSDLCYNLTACSGRVAASPALALLYVCSAAAVLFTVSGNLLVIISVCHFRQLHTPTNLLILSLAVSDFLVGLFLMPVHLTMLVESCWIFGEMFCLLYNMISYQITFVSIHNVSLVAVERYVALSNPFFYVKRVSISVIFIASLMIWVLSLSYNCSLLYFNGIFSHFKICPGQCFLTIDELWSTVDLFVIFVLPCATMIILYIKIFAIAKRHAVAIRANVKCREVQNSDSMKSEWKAAKVFGVLVSVFLICLVPYYVCILLDDFIKGQNVYDVITNMVMLFYLNSAINPVIYALFYPWFQNSMKMILTCKILGADSSLKHV
ncbi:trace amine-associated receptor 13c-like [Denticeps clupeoides]|uniref:G-protein coupled receptors family 1 profile domain-containing protein n=1 Tax=Denticeps clupeoides TaxID=299321 RepID=A0AAY4CV52_9TELE|nr:trace amine-associated receptor 13c-like [Denticeps clupeoides]